MHLTLKKEATKPAAKNFLQQQARFDQFISIFNEQRPHQALNMKYPAELYSRSTRPYNGLPELDYPFHDRTVTVTRCGRICMGKQKINISHAFAGQKVGIKEVADQIWLVSFMQYDLGFFDHETCRIESAENPFSAKVSPMSPVCPDTKSVSDVLTRTPYAIPADNPFVGRTDAKPEIWSLGHRNPLGLAFDAQGRLFVHEMGPRGGDELNLIEKGANYGYPVVSNGDHYDGKVIPDHDTRPEFAAPAVWWNPDSWGLRGWRTVRGARLRRGGGEGHTPSGGGGGRGV